MMQEERQSLVVNIVEQMINTSSVEQRATTLDAVHFVTLAQQQFCKVGAILSSHASDECFLNHLLFHNYLQI